MVYGDIYYTAVSHRVLACYALVPCTWDFFFINMSMLQTVAMATNNLKEYHFLAIFHLFASFSGVSLGKTS